MLGFRAQGVGWDVPLILSRDSTGGTIIPIKDCWYKGGASQIFRV